MADCWFPDNTVVCNFACINRLTLLEEFLAGRGRVVEAVAREIRNSAQRVPHLAGLDITEWFGEPIRLTETTEMQAVEGIRRGVFGGTKREPLKHLGESQTLTVLQGRKEFYTSVWITDDGEAYRYAKLRGLQAWDTVDVLRVLVANSVISSQIAFECCVEVETHGRNLRQAPGSARDFD